MKIIITEDQEKSMKDKLIKMINNIGLIKSSKMVGGYENLKKILKGSDYLTREIMINTIKDYFNQPNSRNFLDLNEMGLEHIELEKSKDHLITLTGLFRQGYDIIVYEKDEDNDWNEVHSTSVPYEGVDFNKKPLLKTIHLYELIDDVMEKYEKDEDNNY